MKLEEAIKVLRQHNEKGASVLRITKGQALEKDLLAQVLDSCEQLISEKTEYKRLLKAAVEDLNSVNRVLEGNYILCMKYIACKGCPFDGENCNKWRYADEVLALIGKEAEENG